MEENKFVFKNLSYEYIRGLVEGEGYFSFCTVPTKNGKKKLPAFGINMSNRDEELLRKVRSTLNLKYSIYTYPPRQRKDGYNRLPMSVLLVRGPWEIQNVIVPLFYKKFNGYKAKQFEWWIQNIEEDPMVDEKYREIPKLYKNGYYDHIKKYD